MGMPISIDIPETKREADFEPAFDRLAAIDERFSTYKAKSEVSRFRTGRLAEEELSVELQGVIEACRQWAEKTGGYFSAWAGKVFDPSGYVKGWAVAEAGRAIEKAGFNTYCIGAGGDILCRSAGAKVWRIGIQDPADKSRILNKLSISNGAVCTSGSYERGLHIINPKTHKTANALRSVSVTGPEIITADVLATAVFAAGGVAAGQAILDKFADYQALIIS